MTIIKAKDLLKKSDTKSISTVNAPESKLGNSALVMLSDGQYSAVSALWSIKNFKTVESISFEYSDDQGSELQSSSIISFDLGINHNVVFLKDVDFRHVVEGASKEVKLMLFLHLTYLHAVFKDIRNIVIGYTGSLQYPECLNDMISILSKSTLCFVRMHCPFINATRENLIEYSLSYKKLNIFDYTRSCESSVIRCGKCEKCKERERSFQLLGLTDPLIFRK